MNKNNIVLGVIGAIAAFLVFSPKKKETPIDIPDKTDDTLDLNRPKGMHNATFNKSFGNIRNGGRRYAGEITPTRNVYKKFSEWKYGAGAMIAHVQRYINGTMFGKLDTISKIIYKYAPPSENDTEGYINFVVRESGISKNTILDWKDKTTLWKITKAMSKMESRQATEYFTESVFKEGWEIAKTQNQ
jgi:hypothetical protein